MSRLGYLLFLPLFAVLAFVEIYPLLVSIYFSVTDYNHGGLFVGLVNYVQVITDTRFLHSLIVSLAYSLGSMSLCFLIGLIFAYTLSQLGSSKSFFESLFLAPLAIAPITVGVIWSPSGVWDDINTFIHFQLRLPYIDLTNFAIAFPIMILSDAWEWFPIVMLVALSILASIPKQVFEAAALHGASSWQVFRQIAIPAIMKSPVMQFLLVLRFIDSMRTFEIPFTWSSWLSQPNAGSPVDTISLLLFKLLTIPTYGFPISYVSAVALALVIVTLSVSCVLFSLMKRLGKA